MNVTPYRVGAMQWLILGALVQAHGFTMTWQELFHHLKTEGVDPQKDRDLPPLIRKGIVSVSDDGIKFTLTEYGCDARRAVRRTLTPNFLRVDDRVIRFTDPNLEVWNAEGIG